MMSRQVLRYLSSLCILGVVGLFAVGCTFEDPPSLGQLYSARDAVSGAKKAGADERYPDEYANLEKRYLEARGVFYACKEGTAGEMAQALIADANALATKKPEPPMPPPNQSPIAGIEGPAEGRTNVLLTFDASTSSDPDGDALKYQWDFGDGTTSDFTFPIATHRYADPGLYTVMLMVEDDKGATAEAMQQVSIERAVSLRGALLFDTGKADLTPAAEDILSPLLQQMEQLPNIVAEIAGHADSRGPKAYNLKLSQRRADAVMQFFVDGGISPDRITAEGFGESQPIADNTTAEGRRENRRVDIVLKAPQAQ
ncbi:MAG: OmpA family protein [Candidatus Tectomicrobia bacterium]|nr:OmpA family protein [Candidatus Tectomicrobia bacterium]